MSGYYTHRPYLRAELAKISTDKFSYCLEIGVGDGSSLVFNEYAKNNPNVLIEAYEEDSFWRSEMEQKYATYNYTFMNDFRLINLEKQYDLVFVDNAPWEARIEAIDLVKNNAKVIILHDYDYFQGGNMDVTTGFFFEKYGGQFKLLAHNDVLPPTLIFYENNKI